MRRACLPALLALWAAPAAAQVTAEDAWAATEAYWEAFGLDLQGILAREGSVATVRGIKATATLPMGLGTLAATSPDLVLTERGDGTVSLDLDLPARFALDAQAGPIGGAVDVSGDVVVDWQDREAVASGTLGDVTFALRSGRMDVTIEKVEIEGAPGTIGIEGVSLDAAASVEGVEVTTRVTHAGGTGAAGLVTISSEQAFGATVYEYATTAPDGAETRAVGRLEPSTATATLALPRGGPALAALADALRGGMAVDLASQGQGSVDQTITTRDGIRVGEDTQTVGATSLSLRLDADGVAVLGDAQDVSFSVRDEFTPVVIEGRIGTFGIELALPLLAGPEPQRAALGLALRDAAPSEVLWTLVDPSRVFPRDPVTFDLGVEGHVGLPFDLLDPLAWARLGTAAALPIDLHDLRTTALEARAGGLDVTGEGALTFDNADRTTFPGLPRPEGRGRLAVAGAQATLDRLVEAGWITAGEAVPLRLWLALYFRPEAGAGGDRVAIEAAITPEGSILINGVQVR